jgi:plasmid stability protein
MMPQLVVADLDDDVRDKLQDLAQRHGRSVEEEAREILRAAVGCAPSPAGGLGSKIVSRFSGSGISMDEEIAEFRGYPIVPPDFER